MTLLPIATARRAAGRAASARTVLAALLALGCGFAAAQSPAPSSAPAPNAAAQGTELPVHRIPNLGPGAEFYFSPDGTHIIGNAKRDGDSSYHVYTLAIDGTDIRRINDKGDDACSFYCTNRARKVHGPEPYD